jgi:hypothetical protein
MLFPNEMEHAGSSGFSTYDGEVISEQYVYKPETLPWDADGDHAANSENLFIPPSTNIYFAKSIGCSDGVFLTSEMVSTISERLGTLGDYLKDVDTDVTESWEIDYQGTTTHEVTKEITGTVTKSYESYSAGYITSSYLPFGMSPSISLGGYLYAFDSATATEEYTYSGATGTIVTTQTTIYNNSSQGDHVINSSSSSTFSITDLSIEFELIYASFAPLVSVSDTVQTATGDSSPTNPTWSYDQTQTLSDELTASSFKTIVNSTAAAPDLDDEYDISSGDAYLFYDSRGDSPVYYNKSGGIIFQSPYTSVFDQSRSLTYLDRDVAQTKDLSEWNDGINVSYDISTFEAGVLNGNIISGSKTFTLTGLISEQNMYRDTQGVFHRDHINPDTIPVTLETGLRGDYGYVNNLTYTGRDLDSVYGRERFVCLDGNERRFKVVYKGIKTDPLTYVETEVVVENYVTTVDFISPWIVESGSASSDMEFITDIEYTVYMGKDEDDNWIVESNGLQTWDSLCETKYIIESQLRVGFLWGYSALDSSFSNDRWTDKSLVISASGDDNLTPPLGEECLDDPSVTFSYSATANYDEVTGWIDYQILSENLVIGGMTCTITDGDGDPLSDRVGLHEYFSDIDPVTGLSFDIDTTTTTETSHEITYDGVGSMEVYYRGEVTGGRTLASQSTGSTVIEYPNTSPDSYWSGFMINESIPPLSVGLGQTSRITKVTATGRVITP